MVRCGLVGAPVPLVLGVVGQKIAAKLPDVVFGDRDHRHTGKGCLHHFGLAGDLPFVAGIEAADIQI